MDFARDFEFSFTEDRSRASVFVQLEDACLVLCAAATLRKPPHEPLGWRIDPFKGGYIVQGGLGSPKPEYIVSDLGEQR